MLKRLLLIVCFFLPMIVCAEEFIAGKDYEDLGKTHAHKHKSVKVSEFFSYGCPWCFRLYPAVNQWQKEKKTAIRFTQVPVIFHKDWDLYAKAFYFAQMQNINNKVDPVLFKAIQTDKISLNSEAEMIAFLSAQGIDKELLTSAFQHSTAMDLKIANGNKKLAQYQIKGVPAFIVNQQFKTDLQMAKSEERLFKILDYLVAKSQS